jgi:hypothetical protein
VKEREAEADSRMMLKVTLKMEEKRICTGGKWFVRGSFREL